MCAVVATFTGCAPQRSTDPYVPALKYTGKAGSVSAAVAAVPNQNHVAAARQTSPLYRPTTLDNRASLKLVDGDMRPQGFEAPRPVIDGVNEFAPDPNLRTGQVSGAIQSGGDIPIYHSTDQLPPSYSSPLALGDPGISSSLWRESRASNDIFRDFRAWQPMDIVTIVVSERSRGTHDADTNLVSRSNVQAALENLLGFEQQTKNWKYPPNLETAITAQTLNEYIGQGETSREAELTARISGVVVEVLASGLLRVEGEKIISVNNEEQVMVISGLVRQRDINSNNQVDSSNIAQMRIDYYGKGTVGEVQYSGWFSRLMRILWPF